MEELFCDLAGLALFGESYLHAFQYLLSPSIGFSRSEEYPSWPVPGLVDTRLS
jgi:hypothetical protein